MYIHGGIKIGRSKGRETQDPKFLNGALVRKLGEAEEDKRYSKVQ